MKSVFKKVPVPMAGLMLGLAAAGNLVAKYGGICRTLCGSIALVVLVMLLVKIVTDKTSVLNDLQNPVIASVAPTFSMGVMIMSTYIQPALPRLALGIWIFGMASHILLIIYYVTKFIIGFQIKKIFPSTFVVFVGLAVGSVTAPAFNLQPIGQVFFWFGLASFLFLSPIILYRLWVVKEVPEPAQPVTAIFAAPASLCLAGYLGSFAEKNMIIVNVLLFLAIILTLAVVLYLPILLKLKFYPSYAAFGFPFVISAVAIGKVHEFLMVRGQDWAVLGYLAKVEEILAIVMVIYVLTRYVGYFWAPVKNPIMEG